MFATLPMTIFMRTAWNRLPRREKYPLPPRQIMHTVFKPGRRLSPGGQTALTLFLHFAFGAAAGLIYGMVQDKIPIRSTVKGPLAGMAVWTGSYLGWIPALGILPSATEHPWRRNLLMIVAHLVWGMTLGWLTRTMSLEKSYINLE